jgi:hypothetical protein
MAASSWGEDSAICRVFGETCAVWYGEGGWHRQVVGLRGEGLGVQFSRVKMGDIGKFGEGVQCSRVKVGEIGWVSCRA